jgi:hypothetical protein
VQLSGHGASFFNAIGPGLELEMELDRFGSVRPALYLEGRAYRTLGNRGISFADSKQFRDANPANPDPLGQTDYQARWSMEVAPWMYRAGLGFRVRWVGR